jgi:FtsZ-binding cell division protein ZapB
VLALEYGKGGEKMPDKKLTDSEIVKAFKCCSDINDKCFECPLKDKSRESCVGILMSNALDLINRLQADKEYYKKNRDKYQDDVMFLSKQCDELQEENERLKNCRKEEVEKLMAATDKVISETKAEAYKEFAAKIKEDAVWICDDNYIEDALTEYIDNLVKELVGEEK